MAVDDGALAVSPLVKLADPGLAQQREIVHDFLKIFPGPGLSGFAEIRAACHNGTSVAYSLFLRPEDSCGDGPIGPSGRAQLDSSRSNLTFPLPAPLLPG